MARTGPFDQHMAEYEEWFGRHHAAYLSELEAVKVQLPTDGKGIEIGVGTGRFAAPLGIEFGVEPSATMRERAKQRGVQVVGGIAEALPFADGQFDVVLMVTTICFLDDIKTTFREIRRILRPGGYIVAGFVDRHSLLGRLYESQKHESTFYRMATFYSVSEVVATLEQEGFGRFRFAQTIFHPLSEIREREPVTDGYGQGSFVVLRGQI